MTTLQEQILQNECPKCGAPATALCRDLRDPELDRPAELFHKERSGLIVGVRVKQDA